MTIAGVRAQRPPGPVPTPTTQRRADEQEEAGLAEHRAAPAAPRAERADPRAPPRTRRRAAPCGGPTTTPGRPLTGRGAARRAGPPCLLTRPRIGAAGPGTFPACAALLGLVNPNATTTTAAGRDVLAHALASELKLEVLLTRYRGHAAEAAAQAAPDGVEPGGRARRRRHRQRGRQRDAAGHRRRAERPAPERPALPRGRPGGSANVFARAPRACPPRPGRGDRAPAARCGPAQHARVGRRPARPATASPATGLVHLQRRHGAGTPTSSRRWSRRPCRGLAATPLRYAGDRAAPVLPASGAARSR